MAQPWVAFTGAEGFTSDTADRVLKDPSTGWFYGAEEGWGVPSFGSQLGLHGLTQQSNC